MPKGIYKRKPRTKTKTMTRKTTTRTTMIRAARKPEATKRTVAKKRKVGRPRMPR